MARVLVTDGAERSALAVVRSLGRAGHEVLVAATRPRSLAAASRFCAAEVVTAPPLEEPAGFADALAAACSARGVALVVPVTDASMGAVLARRDALGGARVPVGDASAYARLSDKAAAGAAAATLGIRVPRQCVATTANDIDTAALRYPVVAKPARSVGERDGARRKHGVRHAATRAELERVLAALPATAFPLLVQERVVGPGLGVFLLVWDGALLASFAHRRIREKPPAGGVSVYAESVALDAGLLARSRALIDAFGFAGVAMVEYKVDAATGEPVLMEINGRFWGTLQLAIDAGVDFPRLLVDAALGGPVAPVTRWRVGVKSRWLWGDVDHAWARLRRSPAALHLPPGAPGRFATLAATIGTTLRFPPDHVFRLADPGPFVRESVDRLLWRSA
jgi:predicted ATP-grasp superfamily ATP-dependent carboligase